MLYTHIYVEKRRQIIPIAKRILERNTSAGVITINHYKDILTGRIRITGCRREVRL